MGDIGWAAAFALASACGFAVSTSLQHQVAGNAPNPGFLPLLRHLVRQPLWLLGNAVGFASLICHGLALERGAIALVQPIMISGVVLAVIVRSALDRALPVAAEVGAVALTAGALACFLTAANVESGTLTSETTAFATWLVGLAAMLGCAAIGWRIPSPRTAAFVLGVSSGICFGLTAGLLKLVSVDLVEGGLGQTLGSWHVYAQAVTGLTGIAINQKAYHLAPLALSMPVLNVVNVLVAIAFGAVVFAEIPARSPAGSLVLVGCLAAMAVGLRLVTMIDHESRPKAAKLEEVG